MKRPRRKPAIDRHGEILAFVMEYRQAHDGQSPNLRTIAAGVYLSLTATYYHLQNHPVLYRDVDNNLCVRRETK
jgi:hypothetical protein